MRHRSQPLGNRLHILLFERHAGDHHRAMAVHRLLIGRPQPQLPVIEGQLPRNCRAATPAPPAASLDSIRRRSACTGLPSSYTATVIPVYSCCDGVRASGGSTVAAADPARTHAPYACSGSDSSTRCGPAHRGRRWWRQKSRTARRRHTAGYSASVTNSTTGVSPIST